MHACIDVTHVRIDISNCVCVSMLVAYVRSREACTHICRQICAYDDAMHTMESDIQQRDREKSIVYSQ